MTTSTTNLTTKPRQLLTVLGIEATQAIQFFNLNGQGSGLAPDNSLPMVANKPMILRVYVAVAPPFTPLVVGKFTGQVTYSVNGVTQTARPLVEFVNVKVAADIQRRRLSDSLNFRIPAAHCNGTVTFNVTLEVSPVSTPFPLSPPLHAARTVTTQLDVDTEGPTSVTLTFDEVPPPSMYIVAVRHERPNGPDDREPTCPEIVQLLDETVRMYPISRFDLLGLSVIEVTGDFGQSGGSGPCGTAFNPIHEILREMQNGSDDVYVALMPPELRGNAVLGCFSGHAMVCRFSSVILAHEFGHELKRGHVATAQNPNPGGAMDVSYPDFGGVWPQGSIGECGLDTATLELYEPTDTFDIMSYNSGKKWISAHNYSAIRDELVRRASRQARMLRPTRDTQLCITFRVQSHENVELVFSHCLRDRIIVSAERSLGGSVLSGLLLDAAGSVLSEKPCNKLLCGCSDGSLDSGAGLRGVYEVLLPWDEQARSLVVMDGPRRLAVFNLDTEAPQLTLELDRLPGAADPPRIGGTNRRDNLLRVRWQASHPRRAVRSLLRYTADDGQTWRTIGVHTLHARQVVNLDLLPGGEKCRFQVIASAGLRTITRETATMALPCKPRQAFILAPTAGTVIKVGEPLHLRGFGYSADHGMTSVGEGEWVLQGRRSFGIGHTAELPGLSAGEYSIMLKVPDGTGSTSTTTLRIIVRG